jgi:hypothetical protein
MLPVSQIHRRATLIFLEMNPWNSRCHQVAVHDLDANFLTQPMTPPPTSQELLHTTLPPNVLVAALDSRIPNFLKDPLPPGFELQIGQYQTNPSQLPFAFCYGKISTQQWCSTQPCQLHMLAWKYMTSIICSKNL